MIRDLPSERYVPFKQFHNTYSMLVSFLQKNNSGRMVYTVKMKIQVQKTCEVTFYCRHFYCVRIEPHCNASTGLSSFNHAN